MAQAIWDSLPERPESLLSEGQRRELERRAADADANPDDVVPWDEVKAQALARWGR